MRSLRVGARRCVVLLLSTFLAAIPAVATPDLPRTWQWPVPGVHHVVTPFQAPTHDYGPGHRGIDISVAVGSVVHAPADGVVAFRGVVVDRPLITIDHGDGLVTTLEPVSSQLSVGTAIAAGEEVGTVAHGGHTPIDQLHLGVRLNDVYINPMLLFSDVPRAVLLPCCA
ncbi:murein hydrolase activator EnvC family protein [Microbacterium sp. A82]